MVLDYIVENYAVGEPIFVEEIPGSSRNYVRQEMKRLADEGKIERLYNGVYFRTYTTILGTKGRISFDKYLEKKYLSVDGQVTGYVTGLQLANSLGFTSQNPSCYEICSNATTTKQRRLEIDGRTLIVYKPLATVTAENKTALQFLDLMRDVDRYSEYTGDELQKKLREFVQSVTLDFEQVKEYLLLYPDKTFRNIYEGGLMSELV